MRLGFNHREGLVLHSVGYEDGGRVRPIAHRLSFAEMVVPYRDPTDDHYRRTAFDIGEWGLGFMTTSLELGCDCLGEIVYLDAVLHDSRGRAVHDPQRDLHPRGGRRGPVEARRRPRSGAEVRRARRLVVSVHVTVANYEYLVYWRFYQDGNIECEVRATGIMVTTHFPEGEQPPYGTLVDERTYAPFHQHFIVARLDLDVDGERQHRPHDRVRGAADRPGQPARPRARAAQHAAAHRGGGQAGLRLGDPARLEGGQPEPYATRSARRWPTSSSRAARFPPMMDPARRSSSAPR